MEFSFTNALDALGGPPQVFRLANEARAPGDYLYNTLLPEVADPDYEATAENMLIRTTMAGLSAMDSPYPETGVIQQDDFREKTCKVTNRARLTEEALRKLQKMLTWYAANNAGMIDNNYIVNEALNFMDKVIMQGHFDTAEWLRGQALCNGKIDWTFGPIRLLVDYGFLPANVLPNRTGTDAYGGTTSKFWTDIRLLQSRLRYDVRALIMHSDLFDIVISNPVNNIYSLTGDNLPQGMFNIRKAISQNGVNTPSPDSRDSVQIITYNLEGEILDPTNPGKTSRIPFHNRGKILAVGNNTRPAYRVGQGATMNPQLDKALGRTHIAPTVEGGGKPGRWARLYTPEGLPMNLIGEGVTNMLPVIDVPEKIAVASSDVPTYAG